MAPKDKIKVERLKINGKHVKYILKFIIGSPAKVEMTTKEMEDQVESLLRKASEGGPTVGGVPVTFDDPYDPFIIVLLVGEKGGQDLSVSLLVQKSDLYIVGFLLGIDVNGGEWNMFIDVSMTKKKEAEFPNTYFHYPVKVMKNRLGARVLLEAMETLHLEKCPIKRREAFQCICYHICEAARFSRIRNLVSKQMDGGFYDKDVFSEIRKLVNEWKDKSSKLHSTDINRKKELTLGLMQDDKVKAEKAKTAKQKFACKALDAETLKRPKPVKGKKLNEQERNDFVTHWASHAGLSEDVCNDIVRALAHPDPLMAKLIVRNSNFFMLKPDLSLCQDYNGYSYKLTKDEIDKIVGGPWEI